MSKSLGNAIGITEPADEMFGKVMRISDDLMWRWYELLSRESVATVAAYRKQVEEGANPRDIKFKLAEEMVARFHHAGAAQEAHAAFVRRFQQGALPDKVDEQVIQAAADMPLPALLKQAGLSKSTSEALRLVTQGGVKVDQQRVEDPGLVLKTGASYLIQVGKRRVARITLVGS